MVLKTEINLSEIREFAKNLPQLKEQVFELMEVDMRSYARDFLQGLLSAELALYLGREKYERKGSAGRTKRNYRNGYYQRTFFLKGLGGLSIKVPRDRKGEFQTNALPKFSRVDERVKQDCLLMYLMGQSTRSVSLISERVFGRKLSHSEISAVNKELYEKVEKWRTRPIEEEFKYLYVDGTNFTMRIDKKIEKVCVLVVIGVTKSNHKKVLALQAGDKESASCWRELFKDLKERGLSKDCIELGIMDGLAGLEKVFKEEFPRSVAQRCQVHLAKNVLCKTPRGVREAVADDLKSIFYASTKSKSKKFLSDFEKRWGKELPSAVKCLTRSADSALRFFDFPQEEWLSLRTTNPIERLNKEFKRRTKSMEIVAGEASCYNLLTIISLKMEAYWERNPIHFQRSLPWLKAYRKNLHN